MKRCVIIGGADIGRYDRVNRLLRGDDFGIYCDCGLRHRERLNLPPGLIVGDFDSHPRPATDTETIVLPREKDDTDSVYAAKEAIRRGYDSFLLAGMVGGRLDHTLGNVALLLYLDSMKKQAVLVDDWSEMEIVFSEPKQIEDRYSCFSLISLGGPAKGIDIRNAKYPLTDGVIPSEYQYGISNEVLPGRTATVSVREGRLLLIRNLKEDPGA